MCMARYFETSKEQQIRLDEFMVYEKSRMYEEISKMSVIDIENNENYLPII